MQHSVCCTAQTSQLVLSGCGMHSPIILHHFPGLALLQQHLLDNNVTLVMIQLASHIKQNIDAKSAQSSLAKSGVI